ncbi:ATP-binding protein [Camelimonas lactis]|uniref:histidine kinase n=1 Tax=Camelimonas lactis TaxID=659006 RepID=A0A4V2RXF1_9HYPH|nr:ATP-binding protein [Camelimonas lactis]TCO13649.1 signal transduction histidine kinase [Camelimonas lactis]
MKAMLRRLWPDTVASRAILILIAALLGFHALGYWAWRVGADTLAASASDRALAARMLSISRAVAGVSGDAERSRVAHDLSDASLEAHWSRVGLTLDNGTDDERAGMMAARLREQAPGLGAEALRIGFAAAGTHDHGAGAVWRHMMLASLRLDDGSWVNFSISTLEPGSHEGWGAFAMMICVGVAIIGVAVLLLRWATWPLRELALAAERFSIDQAPQPLAETGPVEVRRAARAFNTMQERIQRLVTERMQAMAAVSHDLRTPITRLRLRAELLEDAATRRLVDADLGEMETMIDSTLAYLRGGKSDERMRPLDLAPVVETIVDEFQDQGRDVSLSGVGSAPVLGQAPSLKRAFSNLIGNALKYGDVARVSVAAAAGHFTVTVEDQGPGIPAEARQRVFEPFVRLEESRSRETGGSGLGLTIARAVIVAHGGEISLEDRPGGGLRVVVSIPKPGEEIRTG